MKTRFDTYKEGVLISSDPVGAEVEEPVEDKAATKLKALDFDSIKTLPEAIAVLKVLRKVLVDLLQRS